jgi:uncharacterized membrane protein YfcA
MIPGVLILAAALAFGYLVAVGLSMAATFGIAAASPAFVTRGYRVRRRYKLVQELVWLVCSAAGGYVTAAVTSAVNPWVSGGLLAGALLLVLWTNTWEMRQRGLTNQLLMSVVTVAGVVAGYILRMQ